MLSAVRLVGLSEAIRAAVPDAGAPVYRAVTTLGDPVVLVVGLAALYWVAADRRPATARVVAITLAAFAAIVALKHGFALPRPPASVRLIPTDGFGFPSGHAIGAVAVYGGLAVEYRWRPTARRLAAGLILAIALSRVVLGVHYLGDVLAGLLVGAAVLVGTRTLAAGALDRAFGVALLLSVPALAVSGAGTAALRIAGGCVGGLVATAWIDRVPTTTASPRLLALVAVGVPVVVAVGLAAPLVHPVPLAEAVLVAVVLLGPAAVEAAWPAD